MCFGCFSCLGKVFFWGGEKVLVTGSFFVQYRVFLAKSILLRLSGLCVCNCSSCMCRKHLSVNLGLRRLVSVGGVFFF